MDFLIASAHAQTAGPAPTGGLGVMLLPILVMVAMLFFMTRSNSKRQKEQQALIDALQRGDEIIVTGGIGGKIDEVGDTYLNLEIAPNVKIRVEKYAVAKLLPKGSLKS